MKRMNFPRRVEARRARAEMRAEDRAKRTPQEQMTLVRSRRGNSIRERERLISQIEKGE